MTTKDFYSFFNQSLFSIDYFFAYVIFIILPVTFLLLMYFFNQSLDDNSPWYGKKLMTTFLLILSAILFIIYFFYIIYERTENIKLSLSILFPMFAVWLISELYEMTDSSKIKLKIDKIVKKIKHIENLSTSIEQSNMKNDDKIKFSQHIKGIASPIMYSDDYNDKIEDKALLIRVQEDIHKIDIQSQIITTLIVLVSLIVYVFFTDTDNKIILMSLPALTLSYLLLRTIPQYSKNSYKTKDTTLYFSWFSLKDSPTLRNSFLLPRAISILLVIGFTIYYNNAEDKIPDNTNMGQEVNSNKRSIGVE